MHSMNWQDKISGKRASLYHHPDEYGAYSFSIYDLEPGQGTEVIKVDELIDGYTDDSGKQSEQYIRLIGADDKVIDEVRLKGKHKFVDLEKLMEVTEKEID